MALYSTFIMFAYNCAIFSVVEMNSNFHHAHEMRLHVSSLRLNIMEMIAYAPIGALK